MSLITFSSLNSLSAFTMEMTCSEVVSYKGHNFTIERDVLNTKFNLIDNNKYILPNDTNNQGISFEEGHISLISKPDANGKVALTAELDPHNPNGFHPKRAFKFRPEAEKFLLSHDISKFDFNKHKEAQSEENKNWRNRISVVREKFEEKKKTILVEYRKTLKDKLLAITLEAKKLLQEVETKASPRTDEINDLTQKISEIENNKIPELIGRGKLDGAGYYHEGYVEFLYNRYIKSYAKSTIDRNIDKEAKETKQKIDSLHEDIALLSDSNAIDTPKYFSNTELQTLKQDYDSIRYYQGPSHPLDNLNDKSAEAITLLAQFRAAYEHGEFSYAFSKNACPIKKPTTLAQRDEQPTNALSNGGH